LAPIALRKSARQPVAVLLAPDGWYPNQNTGEGSNALFQSYNWRRAYGVRSRREYKAAQLQQNCHEYGISIFHKRRFFHCLAFVDLG
jgi:hypothetical protein